MSAKHIQKSTEDNSGSDTASFDLFVNSDAEHRFANCISAKLFHTERGFVFNMKDTTMNIPDDFARIVIGVGWEKLAKHPASYCWNKVGSATILPQEF
ncbi:hypothetical protein A2U01_0054322 [Trifolium medium]|uniref:Uncharacterized protein n=1 Tax=Trifolium medium TaxID=97028 RepID=A0A392RB83_9FABA|nr:hypothetical protein [Trifolium medium]